MAVKEHQSPRVYYSSNHSLLANNTSDLELQRWHTMVDIKISNVLTQDRQRVYLEDLPQDLLEEATPQHPNDNTISTKKIMIMDMSNMMMGTVRIMVRRRRI